MNKPTQYVNLYSRYNVYYSKFDRSKNSSLFDKERGNKAIKTLSDRASNRIRRYADLLYSISSWKMLKVKDSKKRYRFKLAFITLTIPTQQQHSDNYILENCLQPFIRDLKRLHDCHFYIWKAEIQTKNKYNHLFRIFSYTSTTPPPSCRWRCSA